MLLKGEWIPNRRSKRNKQIIRSHDQTKQLQQNDTLSPTEDNQLLFVEKTWFGFKPIL